MTEDEELETHRAAVRVGVFAGIARRRVIRQRRAIALVAGAGLLLAAGVAVGAAKLVPVAPEVETGLAVCYDSEDAGAPVGYYQNADGVPFDIVELCSQEWLYGQIGQDPPSEPNDFSHEYPVPEIAVCLGPEGIPGGFPVWDDETEQEFCDRIGLPVWEG